MKKKLITLFAASVSVLTIATAVAVNGTKTVASLSAEECDHSTYEFHEGLAPTLTTEGYPSHYGCCICGLAAEDAGFKNPLASGTQSAGSHNNIERQKKLALTKKSTNTSLSESEVKNPLLKAVIPSKLKNVDQGKTPEFVSNDGYQAIRISHTHTSETTYPDGNDGYSEFRFALPTGQSVTSVTFKYKYYDLNHDVLNNTKDVHLVTKFKNGAGQYPTQEMKLINDNEWHSYTVYSDDGAAHTDYEHIQFDIMHLTGELYIADMELNTIHSDIDMRQVSTGSLNYGNYLSHEFYRDSNAGLEHANQFKVTSDGGAYRSVRFQFPVSTYTSSIKYLKARVYIEDSTLSILEGVRVYKAPYVDGTVSPSYANAEYNIPTNSWQDLYIDASSIANGGVIDNLGLFFFKDFPTTTVIYFSDFSLMSEKESLNNPSITGVEYDLEHNTFVMDNVAGEDASVISGLSSLTGPDGNVITFAAGDAGERNIKIAVDGKVYVVQVTVVTKYVSTAAELSAAIAVDGKNNYGYYVLTQDIPTSTNVTCGSSVTNTNNNAYGFYGTLDCRGHKFNFTTQGKETAGLFGTRKFKEDVTGKRGTIKNANIRLFGGGAWYCGRLLGYGADGLVIENSTLRKMYATTFSDGRYGFVTGDSLYDCTFRNVTFNLGGGETEAISSSMSNCTFENCTLIKNESASVVKEDKTYAPTGLTIEVFNANITIDAANLTWKTDWAFTEGSWKPGVKGGTIIDASEAPAGASGKVAYIASTAGYNGYWLATDKPYAAGKVQIRIYIADASSTIDLLRLKCGDQAAGNNSSIKTNYGGIQHNTWFTITMDVSQTSLSGDCEGFAFLPTVANCQIYIDSISTLA